MTNPLGFNNTYAISVRKDFAKKHKLSKISDLVDVPEARFAFGPAFIKREDGWPKLRATYKLRHKEVRGMQHSLAAEALSNGDVDVVDMYSTDAKLQKLNLQVLEDDKRVFPNYFAIILARLRSPRKIPKNLESFKKTRGLDFRRTDGRDECSSRTRRKNFCAKPQQNSWDEKRS